MAEFCVIRAESAKRPVEGGRTFEWLFMGSAHTLYAAPSRTVDGSGSSRLSCAAGRGGQRRDGAAGGNEARGRETWARRETRDGY